MQQYVPSQALVKDQLNQIRMLTSELQAKESETSLLKDELTRLSELCYNNQKNSELQESRYTFLLEENEMKSRIILDEITNLKQQKQALKNQNLELQQQLIGFSREIQTLEDGLESEVKEKALLSSELLNLKEEIYRREIENEHLTKKLAQKSESLLKNDRELSNLKAFNTELGTEIARLQEEVKRGSLELSEKNSQISSLKGSLRDFAQLNEDYEKALAELDSMKSMLEDAEARIRELNNELGSQTKDFEALRASLEKEKQEVLRGWEKEKEKVLEKDREIAGLASKLSSEVELKKQFDADFKSVILLLESRSGKSLPVFDMRSENLHLSVIKAKIVEIIGEKERALKQCKKLTKNQQFLLDDIKNIQEKLLILNSQAQNQESAGLQNLKVQYEEKLNEIDKAYFDKEAKLETVMKNKEMEIAQMADLLNNHVSMIKQKEQEKMELLGLLANSSSNCPQVMLPTPTPYPNLNRYPDPNIEREENQFIEKKVEIDICEFTNVISVLLQIIGFANEKYRDLLGLKRAYRGMLEYYFRINYALKECENQNNEPVRQKPLSRLRTSAFAVLFCEILVKTWSENMLKNSKHSEALKVEFRSCNDSLLSLLPRLYRINDRFEDRVRELFNQKVEISVIVGEGVRLLGNQSGLSARRINTNLGINPVLIQSDLKRIRSAAFNKRNSEENEYLKGKLGELTNKMENLALENENVKHLLNDSENKRSILIQNFKELEKHAQLLNSENQIIKSGGLNSGSEIRE